MYDETVKKRIAASIEFREFECSACIGPGAASQ
jgi:hypothetical protein